VPNVRWPGGCFADEYHWRKGIGPSARRATLNPNWGGVIEPNTFGTHEFMDFADQIGAEAYLSVNVGSGTPHEAADWLEYLTDRAADGAREGARRQRPPAPYKSRISASATRAGTAAATCRRVLPEPAADLQPLRPQLQPGAAAGASADAEDRRRPGGDGPRWTSGPRRS
jgi:hypothetical protein